MEFGLQAAWIRSRLKPELRAAGLEFSLQAARIRSRLKPELHALLNGANLRRRPSAVGREARAPFAAAPDKRTASGGGQICRSRGSHATWNDPRSRTRTGVAFRDGTMRAAGRWRRRFRRAALDRSQG